MKNYLKYIIIVLGLLVAVPFAHATFYPAQTQSFFVGGAGSTIGDTTLTLQSFNSSAGNPLAMTQFGSIGYGTIEPGNPGQEENIDFTGITDNSNGTVTLTGVQDIGLLFPFTITNSIQINHAGGVTFALSNSSAFYFYQFALLNDAQIIAANWIFGTSTASVPPTILGTPSSTTSAVNKLYVDSSIANATSSIGSGFLSLTASGQTISGANTFSQTQTFSATQSFTGGAVFGNVLPTSSLTPVASNQFTTKSYVDGVAIAGAPIATNVVSGIVRIASSSQISTGGTFGTTTPYVLTTQFASSTASSTASIIVATNASTGQIDNSFIPNQGNFGNGIDGNITIAGGATTSLTRDMYYNNLTINGGLITNGYKVYVKNTINGTGDITWGTANAGSNSSAGIGGAGGVASTSGEVVNNPGVAGGTAVSNIGCPQSGTGSSTTAVHSLGATGGTGGTSVGIGSTCNGGTSATSTSSTYFGILRFPTISGIDFGSTSFATYTPAAGGAGGGAYVTNGGTLAGGGGGGSSGGFVFILASTWAGSFQIVAVGGTGGNAVTVSGQNGGGGGGGGGGTSAVIYAVKTWTGTYNLAGGVGGTGQNAGASGLTGTAFEIQITNLL